MEGESRGSNAAYKTCHGLSMDLGVLPSSHRLRKKPDFLHSKCLSHRRGPCFVRLWGRCCVDVLLRSLLLWVVVPPLLLLGLLLLLIADAIVVVVTAVAAIVLPLLSLMSLLAPTWP